MATLEEQLAEAQAENRQHRQAWKELEASEWGANRSRKKVRELNAEKAEVLRQLAEAQKQLRVQSVRISNLETELESFRSTIQKS